MLEENLPAPFDDINIEDDDILIRRINPSYHVIFDENQQCSRISSKAYSPSSSANGGMSVDILKLIIADGHDVTEFVTTPVFTGSIAFTAGSAREVLLRVGATPLPENPYHADVWGGQARPNRFTKSQKRILQQASTWLVPLDSVLL